MDWAQSYDQRQYRQMLYSLNAYEQSALSLSGLVSDLQSLLYSLQNTDDDRLDAVQDEINKLEVIYAVALDRANKQLDEQDRHEIPKTVADLKNLVEGLIEYPASISVRTDE
jgi:hypothetical protein